MAIVQAGIAQSGISPVTGGGTGAVVTAPSWKPVKLGGGGWMVGLDIAADGTLVGKADVYGGYIYNATTKLWSQMFTPTSVPAADADLNSNYGLYEIRIAPSNSSIFYASWKSFIYKTTNSGATWTKTACPVDFQAFANGGYRMFGKYMAVDPVNANVVFVATISGVKSTADGGATWTAFDATLGTSTGPGFLVAFDPSSTVTGGKTQGIYVFKYGVGVYHSTNGGTSWALMASSPTAGAFLVVSSTGIVYVTSDAYTSTIAKWNGTTWSALTIAGGGHQVTAMAIDPTNVNHLAAISDSGQLTVSSDAGATWINWCTNVRRMTTAPWRQNCNEAYASAGNIVFDPSGTTLYFGEGTGVWRIPNIPTVTGVVTYFQMDAGIEEMVTTYCTSPDGPFNKPLLGNWDRPVFRVENPDVYPILYGPDYRNEVVHGWFVDWCADNPLYLAGIFNQPNVNEVSGFSVDGGLTWTQFTTRPAAVDSTASAHGGGCMAVATQAFTYPQSSAASIAANANILWAPSNNSPIYYTANGGGSWGVCTIGSTTTVVGTEGGWGNSNIQHHHILAADRVLLNTFYAYNYLAGVAGVYRTVDGGVTWTQRYSGTLGPNSTQHPRLRSVPRVAAALFFTSGASGGERVASSGQTNPFYSSTDGGTTWNPVANVNSVIDFGFGASAPGKTNPSMFIIGYVSSVFGIWRSDDLGVTWTQLNGIWTNGTVDLPFGITGDMNIYGRCYVANAGSSYGYYG